MASTKTTTKTSTVLDTFVASIDNNKKYNLKELNKLLTDAYNHKKSPEAKKDAVKKEPSAYNIYVKTKMIELKKENPALNAKELMKMAAAAWSEHKLHLSSTVQSDEKSANEVVTVPVQEETQQESSESIRDITRDIIENPSSVTVAVEQQQAADEKIVNTDNATVTKTAKKVQKKSK